jgi:hypothetical protein
MRRTHTRVPRFRSLIVVGGVGLLLSGFLAAPARAADVTHAERLRCVELRTI